MTRSRFTYDRSLQNDVADVLAAARARAHAVTQLDILDTVCRDLIDLFVDVDVTFDADRWARRARHREGRHVPAEIQPQEGHHG